MISDGCGTINPTSTLRGKTTPQRSAIAQDDGHVMATDGAGDRRKNNGLAVTNTLR
ncbi:hypothetical protein [Bremerella alba]|uniref:hypothetical protein n=1 Tax=Bremerella alba TaxID=980252 RepID=UPI001A95529F|nr:hypothetical protein [Bremerella alba]